MNSKEVLSLAKEKLTSLDSNLIDVLDITRPVSVEYAKQLAKVISKLSPLLGNMIEFSTVDLLNQSNWSNSGKWIRQDPGFPDALFKSETVTPNPGIEIKAWFPFATEITARFKDSVTIFENDNIDMALIAWLPEHVIWGKPKIIDVLVVSGKVLLRQEICIIINLQNILFLSLKILLHELLICNKQTPMDISYKKINVTLLLLQLL